MQVRTSVDADRGRLGEGSRGLHGAHPRAFEVVAFPSEGATLRGWLYSHAEHAGAEPRRRPALVMAHGFTATISGMVADRYAQRLHAGGLQVLLFDHRGFGLSGGSPRRQVNRWVQARGYRDAIGFLARRPDVDPGRIGIWGDSLSAAVAICVAATAKATPAKSATKSTAARRPPPGPLMITSAHGRRIARTVGGGSVRQFLVTAGAHRARCPRPR
jgi:alpha-beta hydrolase superfamily lysophospholipase